MFFFTGHVVAKWCMGMLVLMSASLLSPGTLQAEPEKLNFPRRVMNKTTKDPGDKAMEKEFLQVLNDHHRTIYKICRLYSNNRVDQQDLYQEIVFQLWKSYPSFRGESHAGRWLYSIALRTGMDPYRSTQVKVELHGEFPDLPDLENTLSQEEFFTFIHRLDPIDRGIVTLLVEGYERKEIATLVGLTEQTVRKRLSRLKQKNKNKRL